jgi:hypothetical protein
MCRSLTWEVIGIRHCLNRRLQQNLTEPPLLFYQLWNTIRYSLDGFIDYIKNVGTCQQCHDATCSCVRVGSLLPVQEDTQNICSASDSAIHNIYPQSMIRWAITTVHHHGQFLVQMRRPAFSAIMRTARCMQPSDLYFSICWVVTHWCVWFEIALVIVLQVNWAFCAHLSKGCSVFIGRFLGFCRIHWNVLTQWNYLRSGLNVHTRSVSSIST